MNNKGKEPVEGREKTNEELFSDEKTDERIRRHFSDINDVITEQDIENVKTDFDDDGDRANSNEREAESKSRTEQRRDEKDEERKEEDLDAGSKSSTSVSPWNVVDP